MALEFDTRRPPVRASQYLELVKAIRAASTADELDWLEWKSTLDFRPKNKADKSARAHLARAIVGFANRQPDIALRNVEGHGLLVVGVDPEGYHGVEELDSVELERWITPYVGDGIDWRSTYVHVSDEGHDRLPVLIVTVSPPSWGDPIYCIRKEIPPPPRGESEQGKDRETIREATIFVRRTGRTDRARAADIDRLGERLLRGQQALDLDLTLRAGSVLPVIVPADALDRVIDAGRRSLLSHLPSSSESTKVTLEQMMKEYVSSNRRPDPRSREEYVGEVDRYLAELRAAMPKTLPEVAAFAAPRIELRLHNRTHTHLKDVQVRLELPDGVLALVPTDHMTKPFPSGLPQGPRPYGPTKREPVSRPAVLLPRGVSGLMSGGTDPADQMGRRGRGHHSRLSRGGRTRRPLGGSGAVRSRNRGSDIRRTARALDGHRHEHGRHCPRDNGPAGRSGSVAVRSSRSRPRRRGKRQRTPGVIVVMPRLRLVLG
ncbi:helix-turn-helix domain-containing protein, partial [Pseudarthrobacter scleromae]